MPLYVHDRKPKFQTGRWSPVPRRPRRRTARHISGTGGCGSSAAPRRQMILLESMPCDPSFDHLIGAREQRWRHGEAERLGGLQIDNQIEGGWELDGQIGGPRAFENPSSKNSGLTINIWNICTVAHQAASLDLDAGAPNIGQRISSGVDGNLATLAGKEGVRSDDQRAGTLLGDCCE